jgi:hypothetical protein
MAPACGKQPIATFSRTEQQLASTDLTSAVEWLHGIPGEVSGEARM